MNDKQYLITEAQIKAAPNLSTYALTQMLQSLPMVSAEPVAWHTEDHLTDRSATTYKKDMMRNWQYKGWSVIPLYTSPQALTPITADDVTDEMVKEYDRLCYDEDATPKQHLVVVFNAVATHLVKNRSEAK